MAPILGIIASGNWAGANANSYQSIATVTVGSGGASSADFTSIPSTYSHLQLRMIVRNDEPNSANNICMRMNGSSATNYVGHRLSGSGSSTSAATLAGTSQDQLYVGVLTGNTALSNNFSPTIIDILDYANTNKNKTLRILTGWENNGSGEIDFYSGCWMSTSAITSLSIYPAYGGSKFVQYSSFALYGIKG